MSLGLGWHSIEPERTLPRWSALDDRETAVICRGDE